MDGAFRRASLTSTDAEDRHIKEKGTHSPYVTFEDVKVESNEEYYKLGFWTRMGCTPESFKRRTVADKNNQLNQTLRSRHMHMIAIGKSDTSV